MIVYVFTLCCLLIIYIYFIYPGIVFMLSLLFNKRIKKSYIFPNISIIISAYNEEKNIRKTIENKLNLDYPKDKLEIIVVSDGSTDRTDEIVHQFKNSNIRFLRQEPRQGKTSALNMAVPMATGEVIVFADANSIYSSNALNEIAANFADASVGYVTGKMIYMNPDGSTIGDGCSAYMKYENRLRQMETSVGSIVGVDGGIDAVRKKLYTPMRNDQLPDFILPLKVIEQGYRVIYEPKALLNENVLIKPSDEYRMRVRVALRALHALWDMRHLLNPVKYRLFSWQLLSHKILRYIVFALLASIYISNLLLVTNHGLYFFIFIMQNAFYVSALIGLYLEKKSNIKLFYVPFYFCLLNMASAHAFWKFLNNEKQIIWAPRKG